MQDKINKTRAFYSLFLGYIGTIGLVYYLKIGAVGSANFSNNIIYFIIYILSVLLMYYSFHITSKKKNRYAMVGALLFSSFCVLGAQIEYLHAISWTLKTVLKVSFFAVWIFPVIIILLYFLNDYNVGKEAKYDKIFSAKQIFIVIVIVWGLAYLAMFPGIYDYDSIDQTRQFLVTGEINGHHPVLHSFLLSFFMKVGNTFFGSYEVGLGIFTFMQLLFLAYVATKVLTFLQKKKYKRTFIVSACFYLFFPLHYIMVVWDTKDTLFTGFFVLVSLNLIEMFDEESGFWKSKRNYIFFIANIVFMCMIRNNAMYALILLIPFCIFFAKQYRKKILLLFLSALGIFMIYQNVFLPALGVSSGNIREMLSIPCQQMAKVYVESPDVFTSDEKEALFELIPEKNILDYQYRPMISDATKNYLDSEKLKSNLPKYVKMYLSVGIKSPRKYIEAFLQNSCGFWYPNKSYPDDRMFHPYTEFDMADPNLFKGDYIYLDRISLLPPYLSVLRLFFQNTVWRYIPLISNFFVPGTYFCILLFGIGLSFYRKNYKQLVIFIYWSAYWFTLLISPVALVRYAYPVIMCLPLMLGIIGNKKCLEERIQ